MIFRLLLVATLALHPVVPCLCSECPMDRADSAAASAEPITPAGNGDSCCCCKPQPKRVAVSCCASDEPAAEQSAPCDENSDSDKPSSGCCGEGQANCCNLTPLPPALPAGHGFKAAHVLAAAAAIDFETAVLDALAAHPPNAPFNPLALADQSLRLARLCVWTI